MDITIDATDDGGSGVASVTYVLDGSQPIVVDGDSTTLRLTQEGARTVTYWATDRAGNESGHRQLPVRIDSLAPGLDIAVADGAQVPAGATINTVLTCNDAGSGIATCHGPSRLDTTTPGTRTATFTATDIAGNATTHTITYRVLSAAELLDRLRAELDAIGLSHSRSAELRAHVDGARRAVARGDSVAACDHVVDFDAAAGRAVQRRWLTTGQVAGLLDTSRDAQLALRCPT
ncbi:MAG: OmpL47-type beta-barrel domain-containing protein [Acidimicrobiia bacterium]